MRFRTSLRASLVATAMAGTVGLIPAAAHAAEQPHPASTYTAMPMKRIGVNHEIAKANGYEVRVDSDGIEYAVKRGEITISNTVPGECGTSFVYFTLVNRIKHDTSIYTGYTIRRDWPGAIYTDWAVSVIDNYGVSRKTWIDPSRPTHTWTKTKGFTSSGPGWAYADVVLGSIATLANGTICYSHGPKDSAYL